jgi:hypothetical protein
MSKATATTRRSGKRAASSKAAPVAKTTPKTARRKAAAAKPARTKRGAAKAAPATARFRDNADGTVTDTQTGLMWTKATLGHMDFTDAEQACEELRTAKYPDWRLPTIAELLTLVDYGRYNPAIDTRVFPDTRADWYWTSTNAAWAPSCAWIVHFYNGYANYYHRSNRACVRAVRSVSAGQSSLPSALSGAA